MKLSLAILYLLLASSFAVAATINVPKDQPTIQDGINAAKNGDTVLVAPGKYVENINFNGKAITVRSSNGAKQTVIDGNAVGPVVSFVSGETQSSVLEGFTIQNGLPTGNQYVAGGISIGNSSPTLMRNIVTKNAGCGTAVYYGAPLIKNNTISYNSGSSCAPAEGTGILLFGQGTQYGLGSVQIIGNRIVHNIAEPDGNGAGIYLWIAGAPLIENNIIAFNQSGTYGGGGGIMMQNSGAPVIVQNLIVRNKAGDYYGGGVALEIPNDGSTALLVNNTIAGNSTLNENQGQTGPEVYLSGFFGTVVFWNNIMTGTSSNAAVFCDPLYGAPSPSFYNNDAFSLKGGDYAGACAGETGQNENISANPAFVHSGKMDYQLSAGSPAIDAGTTSAPDIPKKDLAGHPRIVDGTIDIGAYEYQGK